MPAGAPVPNVPAVHPSKETSLSDAVSRTPQKSSSSAASKSDPTRPSITPRSAAITAKINYVSPYKQTPRSTTSPGPRSNTSTPVSRANAPAPANANHFKDIVTRFNTTSDEKIPNPTNRIAANVAAATSLKNRKPQTWKANGAAELRKSGAAATDKGRSASAAPPSIRPARQSSSRPASAAAKGTSTTARSTATANSRLTKAGRRLSTSSSTASSDHPSADKLLPPLQTSFTSRNTRARGRTTHRRSRSMEAPSPSAASMADNESDGASQPETNPPLHHRRSRSNLESTNGSPGIEIQLDPDLWRDFDKHPATQPNASSAGTMKTVAPPLVSAHGSRRSPQPTTRAKSPNLTAYISVPLAKSSPTLRSSRGNRLPPPTNTISHASRQRLQPAKDSNAFQRGKSKVAAASAGERKERKRGVPPELETIDFEARRARIQNAFTLKESNEQQIRRARSNQSLKESDEESTVGSKKGATMQLCIQEEDEETEGEQRMKERVEFREQLEEQQQQEQLTLEQQQQEEREEWQRHQEQQEELERLERQRHQEQQEELERLERLEQHEQLQRLKREQQEQQEQLEQLKREQLKREQQERQERLEREQRELQERLKREQLKREQQERQERLEREQRELQERLKREHEMEQFRLEQQKQQEQQQQEEEIRNGNVQDSSDNIGTEPVFDFMAEAIMAKIQPPTEDTTAAAAATETRRSRIEPEERELTIPGAWGANDYNDEVDYRATERVDEQSAYVTEPIDSPAGDQQDAWEDTSGEEATEAEMAEIEAEVQDLVAETEVSSKTHEPVIEVEDEPIPPRPTRFSQFFMPEQYPYTAKRNRSSHSPSLYTSNNNRTSATPIAVVITPDSPTRPALYNATNMLRTRSVGWTTDGEGGEDDNSSDRRNGSVIISNQQQHDTRTRCNPSSNIPAEDVETPIVSPMSAVAHDDRRAIDSFYSRYDDHGEEVINRYVDDRSTSGTSSHQDYHDNGNRNNRHEDDQRVLHVDTGGDYTSCSEAPTPLSSLPPDSLYDYSCSEEATPLSALPRSSFLDLQLPEDDGWTTSSDFSPESDDRGETPTTPRQPTGVGASLPPTPPPKDRPPPPPEKDKPKSISPVPSSIYSGAAPSLHHRSHAVSGSEPLGLAIHSIPAHYDFRPSSERMSSYNPDHHHTGPSQRPSLDSRSSLEQRPSPDQRSSLDHRPSQDQYSQSRPSEDTKYSPPSSLSDSRRSSTLHAGSSIGPIVSNIEDPDQKRLRRRQHLLREIVDTESGFFRDMTVAVEIYKGSANACYSVTVDDVKVLFGNTDAVVQFSKSFLEVLKLSVSSVYVMRRSANGINSSAASMVNSINSDEREEPLTEEEKDRKTYVGEAFAEFMYAMEKVYGDYCKNHDAAAARLQQLETVPGIAIWLQECKACAEDLTNAWNLESLLIKPVQRVLKYPLLLSQLLECTPSSHPDYPALEIASKEMTFVAGRINEMKKRKDMVEKIVGRKRNESDIRHGITKGFARRAEKLRQSVGLSEVVVDDTYNKLFENYNMHYTQVEVVHRDIEIYAMEIQGHVQNFIGFALSFRQFGEVIGTRHYVTEAKWKRFDHMMREISTTYLQEHKLRVKKHAIEPLETLLKMNESPQIIMTKRNNKAVDYARYKAIKDRGDTPDKRTKELADAYVALNETLIEELPRLFHLTKKLVDAVLFNFIDLQAQWMNDWASKIKMTFMDLEMPLNLEAFVDAFATSFTYHESMLTKLSICNGSLNAMQFPTASLGSLPASTVSLDTIDRASPFKMSRPQTADDDATRGRAMSLDTTSPTSAPADCDHSERRHSGGASVSPLSSLSLGGPPVLPLPPLLGSNRIRASSVAVPPRGPTTAAPVGPQRSYSSAVPDSHAAAQSAFFERPRPRPSYTMGAPAPLTLSARRADAPSPSPPLPSAAFSSAMPMDDDRDRESDNPPRGQSRDSSRTPSRTDFRRTLTISNNDKAMFIAASLYEFHLESPRREAGFPYLNYVQGEVFDVIGVKGEIWLARNQDDRQGEIGWIWCKHFRRLSEESSS